MIIECQSTYISGLEAIRGRHTKRIARLEFQRRLLGGFCTALALVCLACILTWARGGCWG